VCPSVDEIEDDDEEPNFLLESIGDGMTLFDIYDAEREKPKLKSAIKFSEELAEEFPEFSVDFMHGKLKSREKEAKMQAFANGETDILVSTTVIEVGVNVPNASLMIVENAERFGLSQLHQLRGRVGRGNKKSYCVLVSEALKKDGGAKERLLTIKNSHDGYEIAEKDLVMRGPGDFLRSNSDGYMRQSGGVRFKLAELCDDTGLMQTAFAEAKELLLADGGLSSYPELKKKVERMFLPDETYVN
jgi:ATP-dependent DNA helicase RecG